MTPRQAKRLQAFYEQERDALFNYALSWTRDTGRAEDLVHQTFARMLGNGGIPRHLRPYVFRAIRNGAIDLARADSLRPESQFEIELIPATPTDHTAADSLRHALSQLTPEEREAISLKDIDGFTLREISEVTGAPIGTIASRHRRGMQRLKTILEKEDPS